MRPPPLPTRTTPLLLQRRAVIVACAAIVLLTIIGLAGGAVGQIILGLLTDGVLLLAWLAAAAGIGALFFRVPRRVPQVSKLAATAPPPLATPAPPNALVRGGPIRVSTSRIGLPEFESISIPDAVHFGPRPLLHDAVGLGPLKFVTAIALGIGILGLATFLLGLAGFLTRPAAFAMIAVGIALGVLKLWRSEFTKEGVRSWLCARTSWSWLWIVAAPIVGIVIVAAFAPPGVLWGDEPNAYDVLEYHLQIPREWYEAGQIQRLDHNAFSYFPQLIESHFLLAMQLRGGPWAGMYLAQLMHASIALLSGAAVYAAAAAVAPRSRSVIAGVAALSVPWVALLGPVAYNEGGLLFFGALAIGWTLHAVMVEDLWRDAILAGVMAGFACGVKLTAGPLLIIGLPLALLAGGVAIRPMLKVVVAAFIIGVIGLIVFAPWAMRTYAWSGGNPVFPEANGIFASPRFSEVQNQRWQIAHAPVPAQQSAGMRLRAARDQIFFDWRYGYFFLPLAFLAMVIARGRPETWMLATLVLLTSAFWIGFTHLQGRFYVLIIPIAALMFSQLDKPILVAIAAIWIAIQSLVTTGLVIQKFEPMCRLLRDEQAFHLDSLTPILPEDAQQIVKAKAPLELIGDAKAFLYDTPGLRYRTVFDVKEGRADEPLIEIWLGGPARPEAYILVSPEEIERLSRTYYKVPNLPPNAPGIGGPPFVMPPQSQATQPTPSQH